MDRIPLDINVYDAACARINWLFDTFTEVGLSFSGGKDSTTLFHLVANIARKRKRKITVLFIDWEVQYSCTIQHVEKMKTCYQDVIKNFYWVALPLSTVNGVSQFHPEWIAWEKGADWVRQPPEGAITDEAFFPFYRYGMSFEEFMPAFSAWLSGNKGLAMLTGIRAEESLTRLLSLTSSRKLRYGEDKPWTTASAEGFYYTVYPLYDWKTRDIWIYHARTKLPYNPLYDLMHRAGVPMKSMRVCEPFGPEQRKSLWLYHILDAETWGKACQRVAGANSGAIYANESGDFYAYRKRITKPANHTWETYAYYLLDSMPEKTAEHYRTKIAIYLKWYLDRQFPQGIPDEQEKDLGYRDVPSWRRICKTLLRNDYWCRALSFSPTKSQHYARYIQRMKEKRSQWEII